MGRNHGPTVPLLPDCTAAGDRPLGPAAEPQP